MLASLLTGADRQFRDEVRAFVAAAVPAQLRRRVARGDELDKADYVAWQRVLALRGWLTTTWPVEHGGCDWSAFRHYLFEEELALADCPPVALTLGVGPKLLGPILCESGTAEQRARLLPPIRASEVWWCQGYSEPGAGSDLAALTTRAVRDGEHYVVTGTKIWTSYAHWADGMCCLARTDAQARPQAGISFLLLDMHAPGVSVKPIAAINGRHFFNQVFLDEVRVPVAMRVGEENAGWRIAKSLLLHERLAAARVAETAKKLALARAIAANVDFNGRRLIDCGCSRCVWAGSKSRPARSNRPHCAIWASPSPGRPLAPRSPFSRCAAPSCISAFAICCAMRPARTRYRCARMSSMTRAPPGPT